MTPGVLTPISAALSIGTAYADSVTYEISVRTASILTAGGGFRVDFPAGITISNTITAMNSCLIQGVATSPANP
jgi:hypothetical protein